MLNSKIEESSREHKLLQEQYLEAQGDMNNKIFERINDSKGLIGSPEMQQ